MSFLVLVVAALVAWFSAGPVSGMLGRQLKIKNFEGRMIPTGLGLAVFAGLSAGVAAAVALEGIAYEQGLVILLWAAIVVLAGLLDDAFGDHSSRGFKGHFAAFFGGKLTTGMAKVLLVGGAAALITWPWTLLSPVDWLLLVLAVNFFNQLDLRPGRAIKAYFLVSFPVYLLSGSPGGWLAGIGLGASLGVAGGDLQGRWMLGDTGANLLGAALGLTFVLALPLPGRLITMAALVLLNLMGEVWSLSKIIEKNIFLRIVDNWGRNWSGQQRNK